MRLLIVIFVLTIAVVAQTVPEPNPSPKTPKYNPAAEAVYKGTVDDLRDRRCPVSGRMGSHIMFKLESGEVIEVHLATGSFVKLVDMNLKKGDTIEVTGWTEFEGVQTIFARALKHGGETYIFRDKDDKPAWIY